MGRSRSMALSFLALVVAILATFMVSGGLAESAVPMDDVFKPYIDYLTNRSVPLSTLSEEDASYARFSDYKIILAGEHHGVKKSFDAELMLLKYLNQTQGVRHVLMEIGYCTGELLNIYLDSGNEAILRTILANLEGTAAYSEENYAFYKAIYEYNNGLNVDAKLRLLGVDVEHQFETGISYLLRLLPETEPPEPISAPLKALLAGKKYTQTEFSNLKSNVEANKDTYRAYLGDETGNRFICGVERINQGITYYSLKNADYYRETCLINNTIRGLDAYSGETFYGIFGGMHTVLSGTDSEGNPCLANHLNSHFAGTLGKVASITFVYHNSKYRSSQNVGTVNEPSAVVTRAAPFMPDDISFCPLDLEQSPFAVEGEQSLKSQQYLVIISNSPEASRYNPANHR